MPAFVTGATGFLGGRLAQVLVSRGERVSVLARPESDLRHLDGLPLKIFAGTLSDIDVLKRAVRGITHVYHCAACSSDWAPWKTFYDANVSGLRNLLAASLTDSSLHRFIHVSTTDVYGYPQIPCDEAHPVVDVGLRYNKSKVEGENCVRQAALSGLPTTVVRPATIYGPRGKEFVVRIAKHLRAGTMAVIDGGRAAGGFSYVDNVVDALIDAAICPAALHRAYNVADGTGATWRNYVASLAQGMGKRRPWIDLPSAAAWPMARAMEGLHSALGLPGRPLLTRHAVLLFSRNQEFPSGAARRDFNFSPNVSFDEGVSRTVSWLRARGVGNG